MSYQKIREFKLSCLRETPVIENLCDQPAAAAEFIQSQVRQSPCWREDVENLGILLLSVRRRIQGYVLISTGTMDTLLVHARDLYRPALVAGAHAILAFHNHPSGDPSPSEVDIRITRDLIRAGQLLKVDLLDHVIVGRPLPDQARDWVSLKELGYFYS